MQKKDLEGGKIIKKDNKGKLQKFVNLKWPQDKLKPIFQTMILLSCTHSATEQDHALENGLKFLE